MSKATIAAQNTVIRNETQDYANTNGRVADVLDDLNNSKPDTDVVEGMIEAAVDDLNVSSKINKPVWGGTTQFYFVKSDLGDSNLQQFNLDNLRTPYWTGSNFSNSPIFVSSDGTRIGVGSSSISEALEVSGNVKANAFIIPPNASSAIANRLRSGSLGNLYYSNSSSVEKRLAFIDNLGGVFNYTPSGNFTLSQLKTAVENAGLIFNGIEIFINNGANNYICSIDIGAAFPNTIGSIHRIGSGSISFTSVRTLNAGSQNITILNGDQSSWCVFQLGTSIDFIKIRNY